MSEWMRIAHWDWAQVGRGDRLHAVAEIRNESTVDDEWIADGRTACGRRGPLIIPGIFSRMGDQRCVTCCQVTGMPQGVGSPKNDDSCRCVVESGQEHGSS